MFSAIIHNSDFEYNTMFLNLACSIENKYTDYK